MKDIIGSIVATVISGNIATGRVVACPGNGVIAVDVEQGIALVPVISCIILE